MTRRETSSRSRRENARRLRDQPAHVISKLVQHHTALFHQAGDDEEQFVSEQEGRAGEGNGTNDEQIGGRFGQVCFFHKPSFGAVRRACLQQRTYRLKSSAPFFNLMVL